MCEEENLDRRSCIRKSFKMGLCLICFNDIKEVGEFGVGRLKGRVVDGNKE